MTKKLFFLTLYLIFSIFKLNAQVTSTEDFETEPNGASSFTSNGQVFNITSQAGGTFDIYTSGAGYGWNGTAIDNSFIDNTGTASANIPLQLTISSSGATPFKLNSMWLFLSQSNLTQLGVGGSLTLVGKLAGNVQYTATSNSGFNTSFGVANGFTLINLSNFGGQNNANTTIDQIVISTGGSFAYISVDAFTWSTVSSITATTSQTDVSCNGGSNGSASVIASGGTTPYTYSWSPSGGTAPTATGLAAGIYTCTITDATANSITKNFTITQPSALTATTVQTNVACNGTSIGSATVSPVGGAGGYTYSWSPSGGTAATASNLTAGAYTCTITDANACSITKNFTLSQPSAIVLTEASHTNVSCNAASNGAASVNTPTGGVPGYTYDWTPGNPTGDGTASVTGLTAGAWTCTVTDANACTKSVTIIVTQPTALVATLTSQTNVACNGASTGSATVSVSGGTPGYTYSWSPSGGTAATATGLTAGTYTCTITDANTCTTTKSVTITQPTALIATLTSQTSVSCNGGSNGSATVSVSGGTTAYTYSWSPSGGTNATVSGLTAGTYTCTITDANGCSTTQSVTITQPSVLTATTSQTNVSCNGDSNGTATVVPSGGAGAYTYSWSPSGGTGATVSGLAAGTYSCTITDANSCITTQSVTITQPNIMTVDAGAATVTYCVDAITPITVTSIINGFQGAYTPANWTFANVNADGNVNTTNTPASITITGGNNNGNNIGSPGESSYSIPVTTNATVSFNWAYVTNDIDGPANDRPNVIVNGVATLMQGFSINGPNTQSGFMSLTVPAGQTFAFNMHTNDNGYGAANITISNLVITNSDASFSWVATNGGSITGATNTASITPATSGTYTVTATNANGCTATDSVEVTVNPLTTPTFDAIAPICYGSTAPTLPATSVNEITGTWSPATVSNTISDTYTFTPTAGQCASTLTVDVMVSPLPIVDAGSATVTYCADGITPIMATGTAGNLPTVGFQGMYAQANWTYLNTPTFNNFNVLANENEVVIATNSYNYVTTDSNYSITFSEAAVVTFNWEYNSNYITNHINNPSVIVNEISTPLTGYLPNVVGVQQGTMSVVVDAGQTFSFNVNLISLFPRSTSTLGGPAINMKITNFAVTPSSPSYSWTATNGGSITGATNTASMTPATSGTYTVTATNAAGCTATDSVEVTINTTPAPIAFAQTLCQSNTVADLVATGTALQWYLSETEGIVLSPSSSIFEGSYYVSQTLNGCESARTEVIVTVNQLTSPFFVSIAPICYGSTAPTLPATSVNDVTGTWSPATVSNTASGEYTFTPADGQCASATTIEVIVTPQTEQPTVACYQTATWNSSDCQWDVTGTAPATPTGSATQTLLDTNATIANLVVTPSTSVWYASEADALAGNNPLISTDAVTNGATYYAVNMVNDCPSAPFAVTVTVTLANDTFDNTNFNYYPNPTSNILNIEYSKNIESVSVINMLGQMLFENKTNNTSIQIDLSNLPTATYFVKVKADGNEKTVKVVKQ